MTLHHYRGALLQNVWLENGYQRHKTKWGEGTSYCDIEGLSKAIAIELCVSNHRLTGDGVRFLRRRLELSQDQLGAELGCTGQAIAKWEKGEVAMIPAASARLLRLIALAAIAPRITLSDALVEYNEEPPEKLVFSYSDETGWQCAEHQHAPLSVTIKRTNVIDFAEVLTRNHFAASFDATTLSAFASNDQEFANASKLVAAGK
jgi:DNA-binding transcriptional regulator YiaG